MKFVALKNSHIIAGKNSCENCLYFNLNVEQSDHDIIDTIFQSKKLVSTLESDSKSNSESSSNLEWETDRKAIAEIDMIKNEGWEMSRSNKKCQKKIVTDLMFGSYYFDLDY